MVMMMRMGNCGEDQGLDATQGGANNNDSQYQVLPPAPGAMPLMMDDQFASGTNHVAFPVGSGGEDLAVPPVHHTEPLPLFQEQGADRVGGGIVGCHVRSTWNGTATPYSMGMLPLEPESIEPETFEDHRHMIPVTTVPVPTPPPLASSSSSTTTTLIKQEQYLTQNHPQEINWVVPSFGTEHRVFKKRSSGSFDAFSESDTALLATAEKKRRRNAIPSSHSLPNLSVRNGPTSCSSRSSSSHRSGPENNHHVANGDIVETAKDRELKVKKFMHLVKTSAAEKSQQVFTCSHEGCNRQFLWKWAMEEHAATHLPEDGRVHDCTYCGKSFFTVGCLKSHIRIHTRKPNSYVCKFPGCTKTYSTSEGLRLHKRNVHEGDKKWKCTSPGCDRSFVRQSDLRLHIIRIHSEERPYPCTYARCTKSFACFSEMKRHLLSHEKRKRKALQKKEKEK